MKTPILLTFFSLILCFSLYAASTWTGAVSTNWNDAGNWSDGIPSNEPVTIPDVSGVSGNFPILNAAAPDINAFTIASGASLTIVSGGNLTAAGTTVEGAILVMGGNLTLGGTTVNGSIAVSGGILTSARLDVNGSADVSGGSLEPGQFNIFGTLDVTGGSISPTAGTNIKNGGSFNISGGDLSTVDTPLTVENMGSLAISGTGLIDIGQRAVTLDGATTIDGGSLITDTDKNITVGGNATFMMSAGSVTTQNFINNNSCTISGGTVTCTGNFEISQNADNLTFSGGTIICQDLAGNGSATVSGNSLLEISRDFKLAPTDWTATGGTVQFVGSATGAAFSSSGTYTFNNLIVDNNPNFDRNTDNIIAINGNLDLNTATSFPLPDNGVARVTTQTMRLGGVAAATGLWTNGSDAIPFESSLILAGAIQVAQLLPVDLLSFIGKVTNTGTELLWTTSAELNNDYMAVERSADGKYFREIGRVVGQGTTDQTQSYNFLDEKPLPGVNYYRLRQVDFDGTTAYHKIISVAYKGDGRTLTVKVFPNPAQEVLQVRWISASEQATQLQVVDVNGRLLRQYAADPQQTAFELPLTQLPGGLYFLRIFNGEQQEVVRFEKHYWSE